MKPKSHYIFLLFILAANQLFSQIEYSGSINLEGYASNKDELPFWMYSNTRGRVSEKSNFATWINGKAVYGFSSNSSLEVGAGILYQDELRNDDFIDELYASYKISWLEIVVGRKQKQEFYNGLSATNESFAWSLNARPLPGIQIRTQRPIYFNENEKLGVEFSLNEYLLGDDRFVKAARLHHKRFHVVYNPHPGFSIRAGIQHYAQWAGDSPESGPQPSGFSDYLRVVSGREGGENSVVGDRMNVLGNHLGSYELYLTKKFENASVKLIYNHFFEDGSGTRFDNFPDGRYGIFWEKDSKEGFVNSVLYEFYYTKNQSTNSLSPHGKDAYFNNFQTYRSGWTYQRRVLGVPFFDFSEEKDIVVGNRFLAHHVGFSGSLTKSREFEYKILSSYVKKYGAYLKRYSPNREEIYLKYDLGLFKDPFNLNLIMSAEYSNIAQPIYGAGLSLSKQF
ncbi:capsule assembly protein Wzi [Gillisia sp. Hel_I_86]|uniref:capsule assembly Wzi family protein n=1 Tax=Gillisia sp. Hel_I_86 TaxID=1249981 RepID=UPI00119AA9E7|nr:capsule assembly Wzi family protein [Gillisia sp. Hel_I_86]TVZ26033.1 capsule assembly protein Wzi [Gillisia sp. Hel_I_86]